MFKLTVTQIATTLAAAVALGMAAPAEAHGWGVWFSTGPVRGGYTEGGWGGDGRARAVCSGERGYRLQERLRHEVNEGEIDPREADHIADRIAGLSARARHECSEGDGRAIWDIAGRYDGIQQWIDRSAHGWRGGW